MSNDHDGTGEDEPRPGDDGRTLALLNTAGAEAPMRMPTGMWGWLLVAVDLDAADEPLLVEAVRVDERPAAAGCDGDVVVRLVEPMSAAGPDPAASGDDAVATRVHVEMLMADAGRWRRVGEWFATGHGWARVIASTAAAVMDLWVRQDRGPVRDTPGADAMQPTTVNA